MVDVASEITSKIKENDFFNMCGQIMLEQK